MSVGIVDIIYLLSYTDIRRTHREHAAGPGDEWITDFAADIQQQVISRASWNALAASPVAFDAVKEFRLGKAANPAYNIIELARLIERRMRGLVA